MSYLTSTGNPSRLDHLGTAGLLDSAGGADMSSMMGMGIPPSAGNDLSASMLHDGGSAALSSQMYSRGPMSSLVGDDFLHGNISQQPSQKVPGDMYSEFMPSASNYGQLQEVPPMRSLRQQDLSFNNNDPMSQHRSLRADLSSERSSNYLDSYSRNPTHLHHPSPLLSSSSLMSQHERDLIARAVSKGSSLGNSSNWLGLDHGMLDDPTDPVYSSALRHTQNQYLLDDTEFLGPSQAFSDFHHTDLHLPPTKHNTHHSTQAQSYRPKSAPLFAHNQFNCSPQPAYHPGASALSASASNTYEASLRGTAANYSHALNLNAHYSSGPGGGVAPGSGGDPRLTGQGDYGAASVPFVGGLLGNARGRTVGGNNIPMSGADVGGVGVGDPTMEELRQQSLSSESQAYYGNETMVKELAPEFVRWFYKYEQDRKWTLFTGYDSIRIERKYREVFRDQISSYSHSSYYPVASTNDESTDFSKFMHYQSMSEGLDSRGAYLGNRYGSENQMQQRKWWPGNADTEFNNGGPGFPSTLRNNSVGANAYRRNQGFPEQISKEKMLHKANSASALLGGPGSINGLTSFNNAIHSDLGKVVVREGLYEVDLGSWTCFSTYWPGDTCMIIRGTWFFDGTWDPLPMEQAEKLEEAHMLKFCGATLINMNHPVSGQPGHHPHPDDSHNNSNKGMTAGTNNAPAIHRVSFNDFHVDWTSPTDVFWYSAATSHKLMRSVGQKLGFSDWGHRICRGYYKPALIADRPSEISHIVFVIHGIGQKMDTGRIVRNCSAFRDCVSSMKEKFFPHLNNAKQRAEFFPVEWRSAAKLDGDVVDAITPQKLISLRQILNSTAMDIMYYTSPLYRAEIQNALIDELNRIYANFVKRNPNFILNGGKVSVMAHSLGAVITYDIMTGYLCGNVADDMSLLQQQQYHQMPRRVMPHKQGLLFTLEHFFCLGSPLSVFLALRWREPHDPNLRSQVLPHHLCKRIYNVFYSSDPVAYRLEPLLNRHYVKIAPVTIHSYNAPVKCRYSEMPRERITIVSKTATDNTAPLNQNSSTTSALPLPNFGDTAATMSSLKPPLPSLPSLPKPNLPSVMNMKLPTSPNKAGGGMPDQQANSNNWGGWFGGNIMKLWKGSTSPASGLLDQAGLGLGQFTSGVTQQQQHSNATNSHEPTADRGHLPHSATNPMGGHPTNPIDDATFLGQHTKENYSTVVDEGLMNIPNDLEYRLDYVLRESQFSGSGYIAALTSHTSYWNSPDAAYFVMTHLYDDLIEQAGTGYCGER